MHRFYQLIFLLSFCVLSVNAQKKWVDVTSQYLKNTTFNTDDNGWTAEVKSGTHTNRAGVSEFYNGTFNFYQTIANLPAGHYRLSFNGLYRTGATTNSYYYYMNNNDAVTAQCYAGMARQTLMNVFDWASETKFSSGAWYRGGYYYPNTMESAAAAFEKNAYFTQMEFDHSGGDINIGLSNETFVDENWCIFDNFKLEVYTTIIPVTSVVLNPRTAELIVGETKKIVPIISPSNATVQSLSWRSTNERVITVNQQGEMTAVGTGQANIVATTTDGTNKQAICTVTVGQNQAQVGSLVFNEVMAANIDEYISPAFNFDGWAELYNLTDRSVQLGGLYMSDNASDLKKWHIPLDIGIVPANGFKVIWFDSNGIKSTNAIFKLDVDGGELYLSNGTDVIASVRYPAAKGRTSYARTTDNGTTWALAATPSPGASNSKSVFATEQLATPVANVASTLFTAPFTFQVTIPQGAELRYTTDGSLPNLENGKTSSDGQFSVNQTAIYRLRFFQDGKIPSNVSTYSYIYKDKEYNIPILSVVGDERFFYDDSLGIMVRGVNGRAGNGQSTKCNWNMEWERPANMSYILQNGQLALTQDVNVEMSGGWSRAFTPHSFKLKGDKELSGDKNLNYPFFVAKPFIRNRTLQVRNGGNDTRSRIKDAALSTIMQTSGIDIDVQSYQPVHEFINGKYIGVLNVREPNNKHYVYSNFGWDDDQIDQFEMSPDSGYVQKEGTPDAYNEVYSLAQNAADNAAYEEIKQLVDIDEFINYMAMEFYLGGNDWPQNNVKGFRLHDGGKFRFVSFDLDQALSYGDAFTAFAQKSTYTFDRLYDQPVEYITQEIKLVNMFLNMLQNDEFRKKFIDTYCLMGGSVFEPERAAAVIDSLTKIVAPEMALNGESPMSTATSLKSGLSGRLSSAISSLQNFSSMNLYNAQAQSVQLKSDVPHATLLLNDMEIPTGKFSGKLFAPVMLRAVAPAGYRFVGWSTGEGASSELFSMNGSWSYYDKGSLDGTAWTTGQLRNWTTGTAPFGYGLDKVQTTVSYGSNASQKIPTTYFRRTVNLSAAPSAGTRYFLHYAVDDGMVVYVNGTEAGRYNMPSGAVSFNTYSSSYAAGNPDEGTLELPASLFKKGNNILAIEVHNTSANSSDLYFDASLAVSGGSVSSADMYSTESEISLPQGTVNLIAHFEPLALPLDSGITPVRINEVSAANEVVVSEYGKKSDWVELYNTTSQPVDVAGYYLSDDAANPKKWQIAGGNETVSTIIPPFGHLVVWCDKRESLTQLHANFKLSDDGGSVLLTSPDEAWTDRLNYPAHDGWHTIGRYPDGGAQLYSMTMPSIGMRNRLTSYNTAVEDPVVTGVSYAVQPTSSGVTINFAENKLYVHARTAQVTIDLYTPGGQKVQSFSLTLHDGWGAASLHALPHGVYLAKVHTAEGKYAACKFVK